MSFDLSAFPELLADQLTISLFAGKILASIIFLLLVLIPVLYFSKGKLLIGLVVGIAMLGFDTAMTWLDPYFLIIISLLIALLFASQTRDWISGK